MKLLKTIIAATLAAACVLPAQAADKTMSTDIVVLGAGCGGTSASVAAQELGAKVILLEKQGITGGTCKFSEGIMAVESKMQRDWNYGLTKVSTPGIFMKAAAQAGSPSIRTNS